ncbi:MAG: hypothetical protein K9M99_03550 [Candidatus Cloacimonetes bacterium]|nr:hypothetical protein [Candidatus Cloacimonadota bacterium]
MNTDGQIQLSYDVLEISFTDLVKWHDSPNFKPTEIYCILMNFRFFNNIHSSENTVNLEDIGYNDFNIEELDLRLREISILAKLKIKTFQELINYPSGIIRKTRMSGRMSIEHLKSVIIETIVKLYSIKGFPANMKGIDLVTPYYLKDFESMKLRYFEHKKNRERELEECKTREYDNPRFIKGMAACTARVEQASRSIMLEDMADDWKKIVKQLDNIK